MQCEHSIINIF